MLTVTKIKQEINHLSTDEKLLLIDELCNSIKKDLPDTELQNQKISISSLGAMLGWGGAVASSLATPSLVMTSPISLLVIIETAIKDFRNNLKRSKLSTEEFVGMWRNRSEIQDRIEWVKNKPQPTITKGDKTIDPTEFFGMWKEQPKNLADIRKKAWHRSGFNQ